MPTPDLSGYVDLTIYDKSPQQLFTDAKNLATSRIPEWVMNETQTEVVLLEALALEVSETVYALNRVPGAVTSAVFQQFGVTKRIGATPTTTVTFTVSDTTGHDIPPGVRLAITLAGNSTPVVFLTDTGVSIPPGSNTGSVTATGQTYTAAANGLVVGTALTIMDAITFLESVVTSAPIINGVDPETDANWLQRLRARVAQLSEVLVLPRHFTASALQDARVTRAMALDQTSTLNPPALLPPTIATTGGTLQAGTTRRYQVTAYNSYGETKVGSEVVAVIPSLFIRGGAVVMQASASLVTTGTGPTGTSTPTPVGAVPLVASSELFVNSPINAATNAVTVRWSALQVPAGNNITGYKVYATSGASGTETLLATVVGAGSGSYVDTGASGPGTNPPAINGTTGPTGASPGYVTMAVYGPYGPVSDSDKASILANLTALTAANLSLTLVDPVVTTVPVTATVHRLASYDAAAVQAGIVTSLQNFLNTQTWLWKPTVYKNDLVTNMTFSSVTGTFIGLDHVDSITVPAADTALPGQFPLTAPGAINITVMDPGT